MRIIVIEKGQGYGNMAIALVKKWCFETRKVHRLWLDVLDVNSYAQSVYKNQGFRCERVLREVVEGEEDYQSLMIMSILATDYEKNSCDIFF